MRCHEMGLPWDLLAKSDFLAFLGWMVVKLLKNYGVQILAPLDPIFFKMAAINMPIHTFGHNLAHIRTINMI